MGRRRTAAQIQRQATLAVAREAYYRNRPASTVTTVRKRETDTLVYASQSLKTGANSSLFKVPASNAAVLFFGGTAALGLRLVASIPDAVPSKPKNFKPAQVHAMKGATTPTASISPWGTRVIKYSTATSGTSQAHYNAPVSGTSSLVTYDNIDAKASTIFTAIQGTLGDLDYARFWLTPEEFSNIKN
jgi:hypothetical protein